MAKREPFRLIDQASLLMFNDSEELANFAAETIKTTKLQLLMAIQDAAGSNLENSVSIGAMRDLVKELDTHLAAAEKSLQGHAQKTWLDGYQLQFKGIVEQVAALETVAPSGIAFEAIDRVVKLKPRISGGLIKGVFEGSLNELSGSLSGIKEPIRKAITNNVLMGGSYHDLTQDIRKLDITKGPFKTATARARAIAITETTNVYNFARSDATIAANRVLPPDAQLATQWRSFMDGKTSPRCRSLNKQVRAQGKDFVASDGWRGQRPAAHPHCRSEIVPFRKEWESIIDDLERELQMQ